MPEYQDSSFDLGGGYGQARLGIDASLAALQARQLDLNRSNQAGQVSQVLDPEVDYGQKIYDAVAAYNTSRGQPPMAVIPDETWIALARTAAPGVSDVVLQQALTQHKQLPAGEHNAAKLGALIQTAAQTATPSLAARQLEQQEGQFGRTFGETQRQFDQTLANRRKEAEWGAGNDLLKLAAGLRGPENYFQYANMLSGAEGSDQLQFARQAAQGTPQAAFRAWGQGTPATVGGLVGQQATASQSQIPSPVTQAAQAAFATSGGQGGQFQQAGTPEVQGSSSQAASAGATPAGRDQLLTLLQGQQAGTSAAQDVSRQETPGATQAGAQNEIYRLGTQAGLAARGQPASASATPAERDQLLALAGKQFQQANPGYRNTPTGQQPRTGTALPDFIQPHQLNVRDYASWQPTQKKMYTSSLEARGYEPDDYFETARRAAPKGQAASTQRWR